MKKLLLLLIIPFLSFGQCEWIAEFAEDNDIPIALSSKTGNVVLFFCENIEDTITAPNSINGQSLIEAIWSYTTNQGQECEDLNGETNGNYYFSLNLNDPCMQNSESITIDCNAILEDNSEITCSFDIDCCGDCINLSSSLELPTINKNLITTLNILGKVANSKGFQLEIYDDGTVEKKYLIK